MGTYLKADYKPTPQKNTEKIVTIDKQPVYEID